MNQYVVLCEGRPSKLDKHGHLIPMFRVGTRFPSYGQASAAVKRSRKKYSGQPYGPIVRLEPRP